MCLSSIFHSHFSTLIFLSFLWPWIWYDMQKVAPGRESISFKRKKREERKVSKAVAGVHWRSEKICSIIRRIVSVAEEKQPIQEKRHTRALKNKYVYRVQSGYWYYTQLKSSTASRWLWAIVKVSDLFLVELKPRWSWDEKKIEWSVLLDYFHIRLTLHQDRYLSLKASCTRPKITFNKIIIMIAVSVNAEKLLCCLLMHSSRPHNVQIRT